MCAGFKVRNAQNEKTQADHTEPVSTDPAAYDPLQSQVLFVFYSLVQPFYQ